MNGLGYWIQNNEIFKTRCYSEHFRLKEKRIPQAGQSCWLLLKLDKFYLVPKYATVSNEVLNLDILFFDLINFNQDWSINLQFWLLYFIFTIKFIFLLWKSNMIKSNFTRKYKTLSTIFLETCPLVSNVGKLVSRGHM
jgi:hypothetical protein